MKAKKLIKDFILPAFWLFFIFAFSNNERAEMKGKPALIKKLENTSTSSQVIRTNHNKITTLNFIR